MAKYSNMLYPDNPDEEEKKNQTGTKVNTDSGFTTTSEQLNADADDNKPKPKYITETPFTEAPPDFKNYTKHQDMAKQWMLDVPTEEEQKRNVRSASAVQSLGHLSEALQAFVNLGGTIKGAAPMKVASAGTMPLKEWLKEQQAKKRENAKTMSEAANQDYRSYSSDYQQWLARKEASDKMNFEAKKFNAGADNALMTAEIKADNDAEKLEREHQYKQEDIRLSGEVQMKVKQTPAAPTKTVVEHKGNSGGGHSNGHSSGGSQSSKGKTLDEWLEEAYAHNGVDGFSIMKSWPVSKIVDEYKKHLAKKKAGGNKPSGGSNKPKDYSKTPPSRRK